MTKSNKNYVVTMIHKCYQMQTLSAKHQNRLQSHTNAISRKLSVVYLSCSRCTRISAQGAKRRHKATPHIYSSINKASCWALDSASVGSPEILMTIEGDTTRARVSEIQETTQGHPPTYLISNGPSLVGREDLVFGRSRTSGDPCCNNPKIHTPKISTTKFFSKLPCDDECHEK